MPAPKYLSLTDAALRLDVSVRTVRRHIANGNLPAFRLGSRLIKVRADDVDALMRPIPTTRRNAA